MRYVLVSFQGFRFGMRKDSFDMGCVIQGTVDHKSKLASFLCIQAKKGGKNTNRYSLYISKAIFAPVCNSAFVVVYNADIF
jgi:hypothetical protein